MPNLAVDWVDAYGYFKITLTRTPADVAAGLGVYQERSSGVRVKIPAYPYSSGASVITAVDYLLPLGQSVRYVVAAGPKQAQVGAAVVVRAKGEGQAFLRDYFDPAESISVRVVSADEYRRPARLSWYDVSGQQNKLATYDVRSGREIALVLAIDGAAERERLDQLLDSGAPVAFTMCNSKGVVAGCFAVGDVTWRRIGTIDRWTVDLPLTEVDAPTIVAEHTPADLPWITFDDAKPLAATYDAALAKWRIYANGIRP
jgi:hypothetical protein